ncbi:MAG: ATP-binding cassette domain-containing protein, partial [Nitratireductor sp.]
GSVASVMQRPKQAYTKQLIKASTHVPKRKKTKPNEALEPLVSLKNVTRDYKGKREWFFSKPELNRAVDDVSFEIMQGQSCALVGQSGCGKSTLARMILALDMPTSGEITFLGQSIGKLNHKELRPIRRNLSAIFQDPFGSFNPRHKVEKLVCEPLSLLNTLPAPIEQRKLAIEALEDVGLQESDLHKYPHEFSGGQRQRIAIARAIITKPKLIICDEPVSALDVSIQAQTLDLFTQLKERYGIAYLFITHDLHVAKAITDTILIMHEGRIVETGDTQEVFNNPKSEAGKTLLASMPSLDKVLKARAK